ncbi:hypothetical protein [Telmatospirillum sp.]|uniref:hypothetical protein n=1 Tax=Telmatospirillum sp. TaxID=2079197 RepID=UPI00283B065A|nr:hypothetical protein [Telmatospirillum sp.]MDR3436309.1 hypothetical protein [Telmatospirillum sp.]
MTRARLIRLAAVVLVRLAAVAVAALIGWAVCSVFLGAPAIAGSPLAVVVTIGAGAALVLIAAFTDWRHPSDRTGQHG